MPLNQQPNIMQTSQFVSRVISFTSEYSAEMWAARNLCGPPRSLNVYGDQTTAWCPASDSQDQILELGFERSVYVSQVKIYENFQGGAVTKIELFNGHDYETVWSLETLPTQVKAYYDIFTPSPLTSTNFLTNQIRISITLTNRSLFTEIDAVELVGSPVKFDIPKKTISSDLSQLLWSTSDQDSFSDAKITLSSSNVTIKVHKCILAARSPTFFNYLVKNNFNLSDESGVDSLELKFLLDYLYTDQLSERLLTEIIDTVKNGGEANNTAAAQTLREHKLDNKKVGYSQLQELDHYDENLVLDFESDEEKWMLVLNRLCRLAIVFKLDRLEKLLLNYIITKFLDLNTVLNILMDARDGVEFVSPGVNDDLDILKQKFKLASVEEACWSMIKINILDIIKTNKFRYLDKSLLIKIVQNI